MTNIIHNYPKTSCNYGDNSDNTEDFNGFQTNSGYRSCEFPQYSDHKLLFRSHKNIRPKTDNTTVLNPQVLSNGISKDFRKVICGNSSTYTSADPRLTDTIRNHHLHLDTPPLVSTLNEDFKNIYTSTELDKHGRNYRTYSDIGAGNIVYYTTKERGDPFYSTLFSNPGHTTGHINVTPMGSIHPEYTRTVPKQNMLRQPKAGTKEQDCGLSWIRDSSEHREDIISSQMSRINRERWMPRWNNDRGI
jgi:hypothetical protein